MQHFYVQKHCVDGQLKTCENNSSSKSENTFGLILFPILVAEQRDLYRVGIHLGRYEYS